MNNDDLQIRWWKLEEKLMERFDKKPDLNAILMLIGIQEANKVGVALTKEEKQDIMHVGICSILLASGYYSITHTDADGWPHFEQLKNLPIMDTIQQELFLKDHVLLYFQNLSIV